MNGALQAITLSILVVWPAYNIGMALLALRPTRAPGVAPAGGGHQYWVLIPALNEAEVIAGTVARALALHGAQTPVRVMVVDDGSDDETPRVLAAIGDPRLHVLRRQHPDARRGKGEALNAGYRAIQVVASAERAVDTTIVCVIDGDGRAEMSFLKDVDPFFADDRVGAVQCRVRIHNRRHLLGLLQDVEFGCITNAAQSLRDRLDTVGMGGNGQFVRLRELVRLGESPWSTCLVEDMELGLRLHLSGVAIRYTSTTAISQQAVTDPRRLLRQRTRWAQGNLQCSRHLRGLVGSRRVSTTALLDYMCYLVAPWLTVPMSILVLAAAVLVIAGMSTGVSFGGLIAIGSGAPMAVAVWIIALLFPGTMWALWYWWVLGDERLHRCVLAGFLYPMFLIMGVVATWWAIWRHAARQIGWVKTERADDSVVTLS